MATATLSFYFFATPVFFFNIIPIVEGNKGPGGVFEGHRFPLSLLPVVQSELVDSGAQAPAEQHRRFKQGWKKIRKVVVVGGWEGGGVPSSWTILPGTLTD